MKKVDKYPLVIPSLAFIGLEAVAELRFHPVRRWRFDFAIQSIMLAIEIDGGVWTGGRHTRGAGFIKDQEKNNEAIILGWRVMHFQPKDAKNGFIAQTVARYCESRR